MDIFDCEDCGYSGAGINKEYYKNGNVKSYMCPVCLTTVIVDKRNPNFHRIVSRIKDTTFYMLAGVWGLMLAGGGAFMYFNRKDDLAATITVIFLIVGIWGLHRADKLKRLNRYIEYRINKFKETSEVPPLD